MLCRKTLLYTQKTEQFLPRQHFRNGYRTAMSLLGITAVLFAASLILLLTGVFELTPGFIPDTLKGDLFIYGLNIGIAGCSSAGCSIIVHSAAINWPDRLLRISEKFNQSL